MGVLIGAGITAVSNYLLAVRKERADEEAARRSHTREVRRAARLIDVDLRWAEIVGESCAEAKEWSMTRLTANAWEEYRNVIASELSEDDWNRVVSATATINQLVSFREAHIKIHRAQMVTDPETTEIVAAAERLNLDIDGPWVIDDKDVERIERMPRLIRGGRTALAPLKQDDAPPENLDESSDRG